MTDYNMLYEKIVLAAWKVTWRSEDPFGLGDANTLGLVDNDLTGRHGHDAKFGLSTAIRKMVHENRDNDELSDSLTHLDEQLWSATKFNDICQVLNDVAVIFNKLGIIV